MQAQSQSNRQDTDKRVDLVLEGGGVKGVGLVGALARLEEEGYLPQHVAGTSVGAIVGSLLAAGYSAAELRDIMMNQLDFNRFKDLSPEGHLPLVGKPLDLLLSLGIYQGKQLENQMEEWLAARNVRTFKDLRYTGTGAVGKDVYRYKLQVIASDLTTHQLLVLPQDAPLLGLNPDRLSVAHAVRMSMSVPFFFEPVRVRDRHGTQRLTGRSLEHVIVDGGLLSNFPVWLFDADGIPTFGLHLVNAFQMGGLADVIPPLDRAFGNPAVMMASYVQALALTALEAHDWEYIREENFARTIPIPTLGIGLMDFGITRAKKQALYKAGYQAADAFLKRWDPVAYRATYPPNNPPSRTETIAAKFKIAERAAS